MIVTFTLNPCIDKTYYVDGLKVGGFTRASEARSDLSGKGVNLSLDLAVLGRKSAAAGFMGRDDVPAYKKLLESFGVGFSFVATAGAVRTNCKIIDKTTGLQTDVNESGAPVTEKDKRKLLELASGLSCEDTAVISGSFPKNFGREDAEKLISLLRSHGVRLAVDTEKEGLCLAEKYGAFAIKPNFDEFCGFLGYTPKSVSETASAAVSKAENIANVIVSLGEEGAIFASKGRAWLGRVKDVRCLSTTGAGDALFAGFLYGALAGKSYKESLLYALATASAKVGTVGTKPPDREEIEKYLKQTECVRII